MNSRTEIQHFKQTGLVLPGRAGRVAKHLAENNGDENR